MKVREVVCLRDYTFQAGGEEFDLKQGKKYTVADRPDGTVLVCDTMWLYGVPAELFRENMRKQNDSSP